MEFSFIILINHENLEIDTSLDILSVILTEIHISCPIKSNNKDHIVKGHYYLVRILMYTIIVVIILFNYIIVILLLYYYYIIVIIELFVCL